MPVVIGRCSAGFLFVMKNVMFIFVVMKLMRNMLVCAVTVMSVAAQGVKKQSSLGRNQVYAGGRIGVGVPLAIGRSSDEISFSDVASVGLNVKGDVMWMTGTHIGIGAEIGYNKYPYKEQFWSELNYRGDFDASYRSCNLSAVGRLFLGSGDLRPMFSVIAGAHYIRNMLSYESYYDAYIQSESVEYVSSMIRPSFGGELGFFYKVSQWNCVSVGARFSFVPNIREDKHVSVDPYSYVEKIVVVNPHGNQNTFEAVVGLHFGVKRKGRRI